MCKKEDIFFDFSLYAYLLSSRYYQLTFSTSADEIHARCSLSTSTSYHVMLRLSVREVMLSRMWSFVPACRSIASSFRFFGARGVVLSMVDGEVMMA